MTQPIDDLIAFATPYALHAMSDAERADIDRRVAAARMMRCHCLVRGRNSLTVAGS